MARKMKTMDGNQAAAHASVSYTHLDVYKRQIWKHVRMWKQRFRRFVTAT